jgi:quercetin dioxygenase-like cupin family protein
MTNDRREFLLASMMALAAPALGAQQPAANPSRQVAVKDAPKVNLDGWQMTATEVTIPAGAPPGRKHRHPGFVIGYVLEGQYSFAVNDQAPKVVKAGEMFFESFDAPGEVHSGSSNASTTQPVKFLAIVFTKKGDPVTIPG